MAARGADPKLHPRQHQPDLHARIRSIAAGFTPTPVIALEHDDVDLYAKLEFGNPTGSVKDRSAFLILRRAIERGEVTPHSTVIESSSGNFAISLAAFSRMLGIAFIPVIDPNVNASTERLLGLICDQVEKVSERDRNGGFLLTRLNRTQGLLARTPQSYWPNQYSNRDAAEAHDRTTGVELLGAVSRIDFLFIGVGTGATIAGLSQRVKRMSPRTKVVAVDTAGSAIFDQSPQHRHIPGIGSSIRPPLVAEALIDDIVIVPELATVRACHQMLLRHGIFAGASSGSVYAAIESYFAGYRGPRPSVAFLCADRGTAYIDTVYRPGWLAEQSGDCHSPPSEGPAGVKAPRFAVDEGNPGGGYPQLSRQRSGGVS